MYSDWNVVKFHLHGAGFVLLLAPILLNDSRLLLDLKAAFAVTLLVFPILALTIYKK